MEGAWKEAHEDYATCQQGWQRIHLYLLDIHRDNMGVDAWKDQGVHGIEALSTWKQF